MKKSKGAVTVFLIIVLFTTVLLGGLFIDATRVLLAKRYVLNALDSAARSSLSYYDSHLAKEYGLFGVENKKAEEMFRKYFKTNLELSQNEGFDILRMSVKDENISVSLSGDITSKDILMNSMKEYSKYRIMVNSVIGVVEKIKGFLGDGKASTAANSAKKGTDALDALKNEVKNFSDNARDYISRGVKTQTDRAKSVVSTALKSGKNVVDLGFGNINGEIDKASQESSKIGDSKKTYQQKSTEALSELDGAKTDRVEYLDEKTGTYQTDTAADANAGDSGTRSDLPDAAQAADTEKQAVDKKIQETRDRAAQKQAEIQKKVAEAQRLNQEIDRLSASKETADSQISLLQGHKNTLEENRLRNRFEFILGDNPDARTVELKEAYEIAKKALEQARLSGTASDIQEKEREMEEAGEALKKQIEDSSGKTAKNKYDDDIKQAESDLKAAKETAAQAKKDLEKTTKERDNLIKEIEALYDEIPAETSKSGTLDLPKTASSEEKGETAAESANFLVQMTEMLNKAYVEMQKDAEDVYARNGLGEFKFDLLSLLEDGLDMVDSLLECLNGLGRLITGSADTDNAFLFTDYVFSTHTFLTSQTARSNRHFQAGEIEYILTGERGQAKAIADTAMEIAMVRLSINWLDYFITGKSPEIISRILIAAGRAAVQTVKDMADMIFTSNKKESATCALCPSFQRVRLTYSDHLRLAMTLKALDAKQRETMMDRVLKLMEDTYEVQDWGSLNSRKTHIKGEATVEVDLVMLTLPMFEAVLPKDNQILQDGKFLVQATVEMGY